MCVRAVSAITVIQGEPPVTRALRLHGPLREVKAAYSDVDATSNQAVPLSARVSSATATPARFYVRLSPGLINTAISEVASAKFSAVFSSVFPTFAL